MEKKTFSSSVFSSIFIILLRVGGGRSIGCEEAKSMGAASPSMGAWADFEEREDSPFIGA